MKALTIKYDPITGAQLTETELYPSDVQDNAQLEKARRAFHNAKKRNNPTIKAHINNTRNR